MKVFAIGASRNIGYLTAVNLLTQGHTVYLMVRRLDAFEQDNEMKSFIESGRAILVQGDALKLADVERAWAESNQNGPVDLLVFSVGGTPSFSLTKGVVIDPPDLCTTCLLNTFTTIRSTTRPHLLPRAIVITSNGITAASHRALPCTLKPVYGYLLELPHRDKLCAERICHYSAGWEWSDEDVLEEAILKDGWQPALGGEEGWLRSLVVVRPAWLTDGPETKDYRVGESVGKLRTISRRDVAHFLSTGLVSNWNVYEGKALNIGY